MAAIPLSLVIGSPVAGWILGHNWFTVQGWRWLFVLEGFPAILLGIVAFFFLTDWPGEAGWPAPEQQQWITRTLAEEKPANRQSVSLGQRPSVRAQSCDASEGVVEHGNPILRGLVLNLFQCSRETHFPEPYLDLQCGTTRKAIHRTTIHRKPILS
jgi:MFS family permease